MNIYKKVSSFFIMFILIFCFLMPLSSYAKKGFSENVKTKFNGKVAKWSISVTPLTVNIPSESLYPGCSYTLNVDVANNGELPVNVTATVEDAPSFLNVEATGPQSLQPGENGSYEIVVSISELETTIIESTSIDFTINFNFEQDI